MGVTEEGIYPAFYSRATYVNNEITTKMGYIHTPTHAHTTYLSHLVVFM